MQTNITWPLMKNNLSREDLDLMIDHLKSDDPKLTHGPKVVEFEKKWSEWLGVKYSVMVNSGASANDLTMLALRERFGQGEIIVPGLTWVSDIASVIHAGFDPVFVDINSRTLGMDCDSIISAITPNTKAVFFTHVLGFNGLNDELLRELTKRNIPLIEDVCESHGATFEGKKLGTFGLASNFSFYYAHHMTTIEGGMVSTDNEEIYDMIRMMRSHGMVRESGISEVKVKFASNYPDLNPDFIFAFAAHNMRPTELNAILGLSQLKRLDHNILERKANFEKFLAVLNPKVFQVDFEAEGNSNYAFTLVLREPNFDARDEIEAALSKFGIEFRRGLAGGGNQLRQPYLRKTGKYPNPKSLPNVDHVHSFGWYFGNYPGLNPSFFDELSLALSKFN
jgi:CDP-6-deoxy-D-xylo-4-hexulose-3-dehydrase